MLSRPGLAVLHHRSPAGAGRLVRPAHPFQTRTPASGAADRCLDCAVEPDCPFSAPRLYGSFLGDPARGDWPLSAVTPAPTEEALTQALTHGPYGRCVYKCDNDVVDHQVVALDYTNGVTTTHTVTAFTETGHRKTRIFGTHGSIECDGHHITRHDFRAHPAITVATTDTATAPAGSGMVDHGDGDRAAVAAFLTAVTTGDTGHIRSGPQESLDSHRAVWAAEHARRTHTTVTPRGLVGHPFLGARVMSSGESKETLRFSIGRNENDVLTGRVDR